MNPNFVKLQNLLMKYFTGRIYIKNMGDMQNNIFILNPDDLNANINYPPLFENNNGKGMVIESNLGVLDFELKCVNDGILKIWLSGIDCHDNNGFPIHINYTNFSINNTEILKKNKLVTHDNPYIFGKKVEDSEIIKIHVEWMPFNNGEFEKLILAIQKENSDSNFIENSGNDSNISDDSQAIYRFQDTPISTEIDLSYMRPLKREKVLGMFNAFRHRDELGAVSYDDALVLPGNNRKGGVIDCNGQLVEESTSSWFGGAYDVDDQTIDYDERTVVFLGEYATSTWGHAHVSLFVRFWFCLLQNEIADAYVIISEHPGQKNDNKPLNDFIRMAGLEEKVIFINRPTRFKRVIVPEPSFTGQWFSDQFWKTMDVIKRNALKEPLDFMETPEKIFLSRSHFKRAKSAEGGLELLDDYFEKNGFTIIYPEELSLVQMVRIMQNAKVCASESGSITFNTLFANDDLDIIVIERIPLFANGNMLTNLAPAKRITYIDGCYILYPGGVGGACMLGFTDELERFTNDNGYCSPSPSYLETDYKNICLEIYQKRYDKMNTYNQWLNWNKPDWLSVVYEAFLASIDQFPQLDRKTIIETYYSDMVQG